MASGPSITGGVCYYWQRLWQMKLTSDSFPTVWPSAGEQLCLRADHHKAENVCNKSDYSVIYAGLVCSFCVLVFRESFVVSILPLENFIS